MNCEHQIAGYPCSIVWVDSDHAVIAVECAKCEIRGSISVSPKDINWDDEDDDS